MRNLTVFLFCSIFLSTDPALSQQQHVSKDSINKVLEKIVKDNNKVVKENAAEISKLVDKLPEPKVVYIKVYQKSPKKKERYIQVADTNKHYMATIKMDSLIDSLRSKSIDFIVIPIKETTASFFYRLFHKKKRK